MKRFKVIYTVGWISDDVQEGVIERETKQEAIEDIERVGDWLRPVKVRAIEEINEG